MHQQTQTVRLGNRTYPVHFRHNAPAALPAALRRRFPGRPFFIVTNTTLSRLYRRHLSSWRTSLGCGVHAIPDGEQYKTLKTWETILDAMLGRRLDRTTVVVAFGGGVVGDMAGFAASAFLRGVDCVQVPTTLLAMVDSSVGGKTGVNHPCGKNLIGAFHQPKMVWIDTAYLDTLPEREFSAGYAELFKYAFIGGKAMFDFVMKNHMAMMRRDRAALAEGIRRSIAIKARVVSQDETESGLRAMLNFGHTFAHAVENFYRYKHVLHGEAVLWGMAAAIRLGLRAGTIPPGARAAYARIISIMPMQKLPSRPDPEKLYAAMFSDKKTVGGKLRFVLPAGPGTSVIRSGIAKNDIRAAFGYR